MSPIVNKILIPWIDETWLIANLDDSLNVVGEPVETDMDCSSYNRSSCYILPHYDGTPVWGNMAELPIEEDEDRDFTDSTDAEFEEAAESEVYFIYKGMMCLTCLKQPVVTSLLAHCIGTFLRGGSWS